MTISPKPRGLHSAFGKLAVASSFALILVSFALPTFALPGNRSEAADSALANQQSAKTQDSTPPQDIPSPAVAPSPSPAPSGMMQRDYMFNWGPRRQKWADNGFTFKFFYITDAFYDVRHPAGTRQVFNNWNRIRGTVDLDLGKLTSAKGLSYHATGLWQNGSNMGGIIGSIANPSGLVSFHQFRLDSMWLQQKLLKDKLLLTGGYISAQDFYGLQEYGGSFLIEPLDYAFGNLGNVRSSYDPSTGPGAEVKIIPQKHFYAKTAYITPSSRESSYPTGFSYKQQAFGSTWNNEVGFYTDPDAPKTRKSYPGIIKVGYVYNGGSGVKVDGSGRVVPNSGFADYKSHRFVSGTYTVYVQANQPVYRAAANSNRGLDVTVGINTGPQNKSQVPTEVTAGLIFNGPFSFRSKDGLALGFVYSKIGDAFNNDVKNGSLPGNPAPAPGLTDEKAFEVNYKAQIAPWLVFQPTYQHYENVGGRHKGAADLVGFRFLTTF